MFLGFARRDRRGGVDQGGLIGLGMRIQPSISRQLLAGGGREREVADHHAIRRAIRHGDEGEKPVVNCGPHHVGIAGANLGDGVPGEEDKLPIGEPVGLNVLAAFAIVPVGTGRIAGFMRIHGRTGADHQLPLRDGHGLGSGILEPNRGGELVVGRQGELLHHPDAAGQLLFGTNAVGRAGEGVGFIHGFTRRIEEGEGREEGRTVEHRQRRVVLCGLLPAGLGGIILELDELQAAALRGEHGTHLGVFEDKRLLLGRTAERRHGARSDHRCRCRCRCGGIRRRGRRAGHGGRAVRGRGGPVRIRLHQDVVDQVHPAQKQPERYTDDADAFAIHV